MLHQEEPITEKKQLIDARNQWNYPAAPGNKDEALLRIEYTMRVCACAMRCNELSDDDRDAIFLMLQQATTLCRIVNLST